MQKKEIKTVVLCNKNIKVNKVHKIRKILFLTIVIIIAIFPVCSAYAEPLFPFDFSFSLNNETSDAQQLSASIQVLILITILSLAPAIIIMMTSFTRIVIILSFMRIPGYITNAANQIIIGMPYSDIIYCAGI